MNRSIPLAECGLCKATESYATHFRRITSRRFLPLSRAERTIDEIILTSARGPYTLRESM